MKVLLDENLPHDLRELLVGHEVFTVGWLKWKGTRNGRLLQRAADHGFEAIITIDGGIWYEQNRSTLPITVVMLEAPTNKITDVAPLAPQVLRILGIAAPRTFHRVSASEAT